jgi:hypothetical protein
MWFLPQMNRMATGHGMPKWLSTSIEMAQKIISTITCDVVGF